MYYIPKIELTPDLFIPMLIPWLSILLSFIIFSLLGKFFGWSKALIGCLIMTAGFGNTSFVGIPIVQSLFGEEGLKILMIVDLPGTFVALSTLGIIIATMYSRGQATWKEIVRKVTQFPPFIVFIIALILNVTGVRLPEVCDEVFYKLSLTISPIALVSVGFQLRINTKSKHWKFLILGLSYQLIFFPALICFILRIGMGRADLLSNVSIIESAMAPMITACIVAAQYGLKPKLCAMMVGIGIPVSFITIAGWYWLL